MKVTRRTAKRGVFAVIAAHPVTTFRCVNRWTKPGDPVTAHHFNIKFEQPGQVTMQDDDSVTIELQPEEVGKLVLSTTIGHLDTKLSAGEFAEWRRLNTKVFGGAS